MRHPKTPLSQYEAERPPKGVWEVHFWWILAHAPHKSPPNHQKVTSEGQFMRYVGTKWPSKGSNYALCGYKMTPQTLYRGVPPPKSTSIWSNFILEIPLGFGVSRGVPQVLVKKIKKSDFWGQFYALCGYKMGSRSLLGVLRGLFGVVLSGFGGQKWPHNEPK